MLKAISTYLETLSRAMIVSRGLDMDRLVNDQAYRLEIVNYLGEPAPVTPVADKSAPTSHFDLRHAA